MGVHINNTGARTLILNRIQCLRDSIVALRILIDPMLVLSDEDRVIQDHGFVMENNMMEVDEDGVTYPVDEEA